MISTVSARSASSFRGARARRASQHDDADADVDTVEAGQRVEGRAEDVGRVADTLAIEARELVDLAADEDGAEQGGGEQAGPAAAHVAPVDGTDGKGHGERAHQQHERAHRGEGDVEDVLGSIPSTERWRTRRYVEISAPNSRQSEPRNTHMASFSLERPVAVLSWLSPWPRPCGSRVVVVEAGTAVSVNGASSRSASAASSSASAPSSSPSAGGSSGPWSSGPWPWRSSGSSAGSSAQPTKPARAGRHRTR